MRPTGEPLEWTVRGRVVGARDRMLVQLFDRDLFFGRDGDTTRLLGEGPTDQEGRFEIRFQAPAGPDLVFRIDGHRFSLVRLPERTVIPPDDQVLGLQPRHPVEEVELILDGVPLVRSEYEQVWRAIEPLLPTPGLEAVCAAALRFDERRFRDISFVAQESGVDGALIAAFAAACRIAPDYDLPASVFYGLARVEGPATHAALGAAAMSTLDEALAAAGERNIIDPLPDQERHAIVTRLHEAAARVLLQQAGAPSAALLDVARVDPQQRETLLRLAADAPDFWAAVEEHPALRDAAPALRYVSALDAVTGNPAVTAALHAAVPEAASLRTLAFHLTSQQLEQALAGVDVTGPADAPAGRGHGAAGGPVSDAQVKAAYAEQITAVLRHAEPTASVARLLTTSDGLVRPETAAFLKRVALERADVGLDETPLANAADLLEGDEQTRTATLAEAQRVQRLHRISTGEPALVGLLRSNLGSGHQITGAYTGRGFAAEYAEALGGEGNAKLVYQKAAGGAAANVLLALHGWQLGKDLKPQAVMGSLAEPPTWASFFDEAGGCECAHCRSWLSPSAYLVDLLLFLKRKNLPKQTTVPLDVLRKRRPDIEHVKLSCENANTTLPYLDIVNEVLESYIDADGPSATAAHDVTTETSAQLEALPQHVRPDAYAKLAKAVYPPSLPFDYWLEVARAHLEALGITRVDLLSAFGGSSVVKALEKQAELLGMTAREYEILTGLDFAGAPAVVGTDELYGFTSPPMGGLASAVQQVTELMERTQLHFEELVTLLRCEFVNPEQELLGKLDAVFADFGLTAKLLRDFVTGGMVSTKDLDDTLAGHGRTANELKTRILADFPGNMVAKLIVLYSPSGNDCDPADMVIQHFNGDPLSDAELRRIALFTRLWRKLGWAPSTVDAALAKFGPLGPSTVADLAGLSVLGRDADVDRLLGLWGNGDQDALLGKLLDLKDVEALRTVAAVDPYQDPAATLSFVELARQVAAAGFTVAQLRWLYATEPPGPGGIAPSAAEVDSWDTTLTKGLAEIDAVHRPPSVDEVVTGDAAAAEIEQLLTPELTRQALDQIEGRAALSGPDLTTLRGKIAPSAAGDVFPDPINPALGPEDRETARLDRLRKAKAAALVVLADIRRRDYVKKLIADRFDFDPAMVLALWQAGPDGPALVPDLVKLLVPQDVAALFTQLYRISLLTRVGRLDVREVRRFKAADPAMTFTDWQALASYLALRDTWTPGPVKLIDVLSAAPADRGTVLAAATGWPEPVITAALTALGKADLGDMPTLTGLARVMVLRRLAGVPAAVLKDWAEPADKARANAIIAAVQAQHDEASWLETAKGINDPMREKRRDALVAFTLTMEVTRKAGARTSDDLFGLLLIDVNMSSCMPTSRIKTLILSVQLFVQRCVLNLENPAVTPSMIDVEQWEWRQFHPVWEAHRRTFLFPENYLEPQLRHDRSPFFKELEGELSESDVDAVSAERALLSYLEKLHAVANLEVVGFHRQADDDTLHVVGRTRAGAPRKYYYRRQVRGKEWTPWEPVSVDIQGVEVSDDSGVSGAHVLPVIWRGTLWLFWPEFMKRQEKAGDSKVDYGVPVRSPAEYWEIRMAWTRYEQGHWTSKQLSADYVKYTEPEPNWGFGGTIRYGTVGGITGGGSIGLYFWRPDGPGPFRLHSRLDLGGNRLHVDLWRASKRLWDVSFEHPVAPPGWISSNVAEELPLIGGGLWFQQLRSWGSFGLQVLNSYGSTTYRHEARLLEAGNTWNFTLPGQTDIDMRDNAGFYQDLHRGYLVRLGRRTAALWPGPSAPSSSILNPKIKLSIDSVVWAKLVFEYTVGATFSTFFHPHVAEFGRRLKQQGLDGLYTLDSQRLGTPKEFTAAYKPTPLVSKPDDVLHDVDFSPLGAYSGYNWEIFLHIPVLLATLLGQHQRHADAERWFRRVLDLTDSTPPDPKDPTTLGVSRFWKVRPLRETEPERLEDMFAKLKPGDPTTAEEQAIVDQLEDLARNPFQPFRVARLRPIAYQKMVLMKWMDNELARGDMEFRRDTIESINRATQHYLRVASVLGKRRETVRTHKQAEPQSFAQLEPRLDAAGNAMVEMENRFPLTGTILPDGAENGISALLGLGTGLYFCIPDNDKLASYWDLVEDRLFKIRHCMNIEGVARKLALFEPAIDPMLLIRARAAGLDLGSVLSDLAAPMPHYRFTVMLQRAGELCNEVRAYGAAVLAALEKKDGEALALLRARHEPALLKEVSRVKEWQLAEARAGIDALLAQRNAAVERLMHFIKLRGATQPNVPSPPTGPQSPDDIVSVPDIPVDEAGGKFTLVAGGKISMDAGGAVTSAIMAGPTGALVGGAIDDVISSMSFDIDSGTKLLAHEKHSLTQAFLAAANSAGAGAVEALVAFLGLMPQFSIDAKPFGVGGSISFGGGQLAAPAAAAGRAMSAFSGWQSFQADAAQQLAGFIWREQDHWYQSRNAALEIQQIDRQIIAAQLRYAMYTAEKATHDKQLEQAQAITDFFEAKYTSTDLYAHLAKETGSLYFKAYQLAYDLARQAERCYRFELGVKDSSIVQFGYWDGLNKGLLAGERLQVALRQLERAYLDGNKRSLEITRHVSLRRLDPAALLALRTTGSCEFTLTEDLFDLDFPGHYFRRLKTVAVSVPCVVGPYTSVNGTLTLLSNKLRAKPLPNSPYPEKQPSDERFWYDHVPVQSIATSTPQQDTGMFELNFHDERYLPFEGGGAVSRWRFTLPDVLRQFDYETISDLILHVRYTAVDAGLVMRKNATAAVTKSLKDDGLVQLFSARSDFPDEFHRAYSTTPGPLTVPISRDGFPYLAGRGTIKATKLTVVVVGVTPQPGNASVSVAEGSPVALTAGTRDGLTIYSGAIDVPVGNPSAWKIELPGLPGKPREVMLLLDYTVTLPA